MALTWAYRRSSVPPSYSGVVFPVDTMRVTLPFAAPYPPRYYSLSNPHKGLDVAPFPGSFGEPVRASVSGEVVKAVKATYGMGNYVAIETALGWTWGAHDERRMWQKIAKDEPFWVILGHLQSVNVSKGDEVASSQQIGRVGSVGVSSGAHVHVEIRIRDYAQRLVVNPDEFFAAHIVGYQQTRVYKNPADEAFARAFTYGEVA